ncbi:MT-A70 family methyltransferase [Mesorhizobium qingshengii]|uniref:MT-A70 family methyltransferase n=1 Tax=Mesorhizobium qingshengii TaxID=1165689 RepID=A0ABT4R4L5_9HYPH|nr:MT-A70 family methyltransferase [Mesorhizobium qingshengii]MCZ8548695.1 MT-A70 family methyltransferase [Mesorhizobium qingshengii]
MGRPPIFKRGAMTDAERQRRRRRKAKREKGIAARKAERDERIARVASRETAISARIIAMPIKRYGVVYADCEWSFEPYSRVTGMSRAADNHYPTSPTRMIMERDVPSICAPDSILYLWATVPMLLDALAVMARWGFTYKSHAIWFKQRPGNGRGTGYWFTGEHELLLVGTKGKVPAPAMGTQSRSVIIAPVGAHSAKPDAVLEMIERYHPTLPKIELNRRGPARAGWDAWGNEAE